MYLSVRKELPRLPLDGKLDLTYRCSNHCIHCWLWLPANAPQAQEELTYEEIRRIVDEARSMGCQAWNISGGEPMLRPDFPDILDYISRKSVTYNLNTNGTLITPQIARLLARKGKKMVALYGATAAVHDQVTRTPGSFEATIRGMHYLREAGVNFIVQIVPMQANFHQYQQMLELALSLSPVYRIGAPWLWLSACRSETRNRLITSQRLSPATVIALDEPDPAEEEILQAEGESSTSSVPTLSEVTPADDRLFAACIADRRDFHIDPYGQMTFCCFIKEPALRYNLRQGTFEQAWDEFIPSLADVVRGGQEYLDHCGTCDLRQDCQWCAVYAYLEHGRYSAKVDYLCHVAAEARRFKDQWRSTHLRYYQIAGMTIRVAADFPFTEDTFAPSLSKFRLDNPGADLMSIRLVPSLPSLPELKAEQEVYRQPPWAIYRLSHSWVYLEITSEDGDNQPHAWAVFDVDHSQGTIFRDAAFYETKNLPSLTTFISDQILLARALANHQACYLHSAGIIIDGKGLLFVGHSEAGKSTIMKMLREYGEILCDDRIVVRHWPEGFHIHGTWSHGELPDISPAGAPLQAIFFLEKAPTNELIPLTDMRERLGRLLSHLVKPLATADWWDKVLPLVGKIATDVPAYRLLFDQSGRVVDLLRQLQPER